MKKRPGRLPGLLSCMLCGCASGTPAPPKPLPPPGPTLEAPRAAEPPSLGEAPVEKPRDLAMWIHMPAPGRDLPVVGLLIPMDPAVQAVLQQPELVLRLRLGPELGQLVDLARPVEIAIASKQGGEVDMDRVVFGFTLAEGVDPGRALEESFTLHRNRGGGIALERKSEGAEESPGSKLTCTLWPATTPELRDRLVCATDAEMLPSYGPYVARGTAAAATGANLRIELDRAMFGALLPDPKALSGPDAEDPGKRGERLGAQWAHDFVSDWDTMALEMSLERGRVELAAEQTFRSSRSMAAVMACADPRAAVAAPPALFRMPADTDMAFFFQGAPKETMKIRGPAAFREFAQVFPVHEVPLSAHDEIAGAFSSVLLTGGPLVMAHGHDRQGARAALDRYLATKPPRAGAKPAADPGIQSARRALQGWTLAYANEPTEAWQRGLREILRIMNKDYETEARKALSAGAGAAGAPPPPPAPDKPSRELTKMSEVRVLPSDALPAGSLHFVISSKPNPKYVQQKSTDKAPGIPHELHLWLAPEGISTWMGWSEDPRLARSMLGQVLGKGGSAPATAAPGLDSLQGTRAAGVGIVTLAGLVSLFLPEDSRADMENARSLLERRDALPGKGESALSLVWTAEPLAEPLTGQPTSQGCRARLSVSLDPGALRDAIAWVVASRSGRSP